MYLPHFGLSERPFRITPHTDFFFAGANRGATLEALIYAIARDDGIVQVIGEVGSGKTMLCRMLTERLPDQVEVAFLANPTLGPEDTLHALAAELQLNLGDARPGALLQSLQAHLIALHAAGRRLVVLVDEAHAMPASTLEQIRLLSNLETRREKLLQIVLFGQPELTEVLNRPQMRQLKDRITHRFTLGPLGRGDVAAYLDFRMRAAGYRGPKLFSPRAERLIAQVAAGLTRRINILADKALLAAFASGKHEVGAAEVRAAARDAGMPAPRPLAAVAAGLALLAAAGSGGWWLLGGPPARPASAPAPATPATPADPAPAVSPAPTAAPVTVAPAGEAPASPALLASPASLATAQAPVVRTEALLAQTEAWLAGAPDERWFLQLLSAEASDAAEQVDRFLARAAGQLDAARLRVYRARVGDVERLGVIYGEFASLDEANRALSLLPAALRADGAFPRQVKLLKP